MKQPTAAILRIAVAALAAAVLCGCTVHFHLFGKYYDKPDKEKEPQKAEIVIDEDQ